jgi:alcohol dehydrogenase
MIPPAASSLPSHSAFDHQPRTRLVFGINSVERIGELARDLAAQRILVVTDPGIVTAGHAHRVEHLLQAAGLGVVVFEEVIENPTTRCVENCLRVARSAGIDTIIGLRGGEQHGYGKGLQLSADKWRADAGLLGFRQSEASDAADDCDSHHGGHGSECQSFALIADEHTHQKMACGDPKAAARIAILDPALTVSQPPRVTACTGIDAISHAVESAVTRKRNPLSLMYSHEAFKLCVRSFPRVLSHPNDLESRGRMLLGAAFAGMAIENSLLGAAHAAANPLTAHYGIVHGDAVGMMLPVVVRFNGRDPQARRAYAELASAPEIAGVTDGLDIALDALIARLESLSNLGGIPRSLADCGVERSKIKMLAEEAARQWTAAFNPRSVTVEDFVHLYEAAFIPRGDGTRVRA